MKRDVAEYEGIKYSLQPHGLKSRLLVAFFSFVVVFGGALLAASPAEANPGDVSCFVEITADPSSPTATTTPIPCPTIPAPTTVTTIVTVAGPKVVVTKTETKTMYVTVTQKVMTTPDRSFSTPPPFSVVPTPSHTPSVVLPVSSSGDSGTMVGWALGVIGIAGGAAGVALATSGIVGVLKRRRYQGAHSDSSQTQVIPIVNSDDYSISDYDPNAGEYDPALGGYAGQTAEMPPVDTETKTLPPVE